jgi:hypothetical protein
MGILMVFEVFLIGNVAILGRKSVNLSDFGEVFIQKRSKCQKTLKNGQKWSIFTHFFHIFPSKKPQKAHISPLKTPKRT